MILYFIKVALLMTILLIFYKLFLSKINTFKFNRFYLLSSLMLSVSIPLIVLPEIIPPVQKVSHKIDRVFEFEKKDIAIQNEIEPIVVTKTDTESLKALNPNILINKEAQYPISVKTVFISIYFIGVILFGGIFISKLMGFFKLIKSNQRKQNGYFDYVLLENETLPFVFLKYFFINKQVYENGQLEREIEIHELAHIKQKHTLDILVVEVLRVIFWFNPILSIYKKAIQLNHEFLADDAVNKTFRNETAYQLLLLSKITHQSESFVLSSSVNYSITKKRFQMMAVKTLKSKSIFIKSYTMALSALSLLVFSSSAQNFHITPHFPFGQSLEKYEELIENALEVDDLYALVLKNLDINNLRNAYNSLSEEEKENASEFPFLEDEAFAKLKKLQENSDKIKVTFKFSTPPAKKTIREEVWENWKKEKNVTIEIDDKLVDANLDDYSKEDFALHQVVETRPKGTLKKPEYLLKLTTHDYYEIKHIRVKKVLNDIIAEYQNEDKLDIMYFMKGINKKVNNKKENLEDIILEGILNHEQKEYKPGPHYHEGVFIPASLTTKNEKRKSVNIFKEQAPKF